MHLLVTSHSFEELAERSRHIELYLHRIEGVRLILMADVLAYRVCLVWRTCRMIQAVRGRISTRLKRLDYD
jgi:hypothetical protein